MMVGRQKIRQYIQTRASNESCRCVRLFRSWDLYLDGLSKAILFHPPVECAAAEAQRLRRLAHVAIATSQRLANEDTLNCLQAHLLKACGRDARSGQAEVRKRNTPARGHQYGTL